MTETRITYRTRNAYAMGQFKDELDVITSISLLTEDGKELLIARAWWVDDSPWLVVTTSEADLFGLTNKAGEDLGSPKRYPYVVIGEWANKRDALVQLHYELGKHLEATK